MAAPHPENAEGDFYVEDGCCITCGVPEDRAPGIFGWVDDPKGYTHCVVKRQPSTSLEITQTLEAMASAEVDCIRYKGRAEEILRRIGEMGEAHLSDEPLPAGAHFIDRDRVTFTIRDAAQLSAADLASEFEHYLEAVNRQRETALYEIEPRSPNAPKVRFSWFRGAFHAVTFETLKSEPGFVAMADPAQSVLPVGVPTSIRGISRLIDEWLRGSERFQDLRWYSAEQWRKGGPWRETLF
jgi:hypothetical protein